MKKCSIILLVVLSLFDFEANSQNLIAIQNGSIQTFQTTLDQAINNATDGDTIFIPGGIFTITNPYLNKRIHIFGVGHNPDSTIETNPTIINSTIYLQQEASSGSLSGVKISGWINAYGVNLTNYCIHRCYFNGLSLSSSSSNNLFSENIIDGVVSGGGCQNNFFYNNIITGGITSFYNNNIFRNNIIKSVPSLACNELWGFSVSDLTGCIIENNIFNGSICVWNCIVKNNLLVNSTLAYAQGCIILNNILNIDMYNVFINYSLNNPFNYAYNYHLQSTCPGRNAGTDGTDMGIYGGMFPWKDGSLPPNPHIQTKIIGQTTDDAGNLNVNIKVAAQDR
ncbi:hypothetical protein HXX01_02500 [Candidatus Nomurabacteria bacterium]|nr:hypothetical protein [Candidatus Nomurabacteria bacterium]